MELRVLQYFLAVTREQSISGAAEALHISQPTLSRQLKDMEEEFGKQLFIRGNRKITLTEEGMILRKRAEEIIDLVQKTEKELKISDNIVAGDIYIGAGESDKVSLIVQTVKELQGIYPDIHLHIISGDTIDVIESLDKGLIDFGLVFSGFDTSKHNCLKLPMLDTWGVLMRKDSPLADNDFITPKQLWDKPLIMNRNERNGDDFLTWLQKDTQDLNIVATYSLIFNASLMVNEGLGYAIGIDKILNLTGVSNLIFKPVSPGLEFGMYLIWKKYQIFSKASELFLETIRQNI